MVAMLSAMMPLISGCIAVAAVGAGAGAVAYLKGTLDSHLNASLETSLPVVRDAMKGMGYVKTKEISDTRTAKIIYRDSLDQKIIITLNQKTSNLTAISVRVGHVGDENRSIEILEEIQDLL